MTTTSALVPLLIVRGAARAIDFYVKALGATVLACYEHGTERRVSHADLAIAGAPFALTEEARAFNSDAPPSLGGSPVVLQLFVADAEAVVACMCGAGAAVVFPVEELFGERMARVRDPFGHLWILRERVEELSVAEIQRRRDELFARFSAGAVSPESATAFPHVEEKPSIGDFPARVQLVVGPVGAGKSTFALALARETRAVRLTLDEWMATLFRPDRPASGVPEWYAERAARSLEQIWKVANELLALGVSVVLELGLLRQNEREAFYERVEDAGFELTTHVVDAPRDVRRERVAERNRSRGPTFSMVVPPDLFEFASDLWEPPDAAECRGRDVRFVDLPASEAPGSG
jgi:predicted kinase/uncharacterized glyoxalase superfamily protein PhnB